MSFIFSRHLLTKDKRSITILPASNEEGVIDFGTVDMTKSKSVQLHLRNNCENEHSFGFVVRRWGSDFRIEEAESDVIDDKKRNVLFGHGFKDIRVKVGANNTGVFRVVLSFWFKCGGREPFHIIKFIKGEVADIPVNVKPRSGTSTVEAKLVQGQPPVL